MDSNNVESARAFGNPNFDGYNNNGNRRTKTRDCFDMMFTYVNYDLLISKLFYFFFFAAFGSLFPLLAVYFKQLGMNPVQAGVLIGFRPFIEYVGVPFWGTLADRWKRWKTILLFSLFCLVAFTLALAFIQPPVSACLAKNATSTILLHPFFNKQGYRGGTMGVPRGINDFNANSGGVGAFTRGKRELGDLDAYDYKRLHPGYGDLGKSPIPLLHETIANAGPRDVEGLASPPFSSVVYNLDKVEEAFLLLLLLVIIGEFTSAPAITLADAATLGYLGDDAENYGKQRIFGSIGWALAMFFVGLALDHSNIFPDHPCGKTQLGERNYTVCFAVFSVLMSCAFITATQFRFSSEGPRDIALSQVKDKVVEKVQKRITRRRKYDRQGLIEEDSDEDSTPRSDETPGPMPQDDLKQSDSYEKKVQISLKSESEELTEDKDMITDVMDSRSFYIPRGKMGQSGTMPEWVTVIRLFGTVHYGAMLYLGWFMGFGIGLVFAFLFWHLQDLGGAPTLFGIASVINHISEIFAFFFCRKLILAIGQTKVMYLGLAGNIARFLYISWLRNPWWVLPFEFVQGLTHAAVWAACCSYMTQGLPTNLHSTAQGVITAVHHGLGRGCGALIGGVFVHYFGTEYTFRGYGITCIVILVAYFALNYFYRDRFEMTSGGHGPHQILEETSHLAPCGVPVNPVSRNLSSGMLEDKGYESQHGYGTAQNNGYSDPNAAPQGPQQGYQSGYVGGYQYKVTPEPEPQSNGKLHWTYPADYETIKKHFQAYRDALSSDCLEEKPVTRTLIMRTTPEAVMKPHLLQPPPVGAMAEESDEGEWF